MQPTICYYQLLGDTLLLSFEDFLPNMGPGAPENDARVLEPMLMRVMLLEPPAGSEAGRGWQRTWVALTWKKTGS